MTERFDWTTLADGLTTLPQAREVLKAQGALIDELQASLRGKCRRLARLRGEQERATRVMVQQQAQHMDLLRAIDDYAMKLQIPPRVCPVCACVPCNCCDTYP